MREPDEPSYVPRPRAGGDIRGYSSDPLAPGNLHGEIRQGRQSPVVDSPNGPVQYQNPGHPWLESKGVPQLPAKRRVGRPFKGRIVTTPA